MGQTNRRTTQTQYVDLVIKESRPSLLKRLRGDYRICTLTKSRNERMINLRIPNTMQDRIIEAYESGKTVRIFA